MTVIFIYTTKKITKEGFWNNACSVIENMKSKFDFQSSNLFTSLSMNNALKPAILLHRLQTHAGPWLSKI